MNIKTSIANCLAIALVATPLVSSATEGALGRAITGVQAMSYSGLIPPTPGFSMSLGYVHYSGDISTSRQIPIAGEASLGLDATLDMETVTGVYIWDTGQGAWNFASMVTVPFIQVDASADVGLGPLQSRLSDSTSGLFDIFFAPVIASYHLDPMRHVSLSVYFYAPTGDYEAGRLANSGLNVWTYSPTVGYTQLFAGGAVEWSSTTAVDFYTRNDDTDYRNGAVFRLDSLLLRRYANGWGFGGVAGWIEQLQDDSGPLADRLDGFRGRAFAVGPIVSYARKSEHSSVEFSARWMTEFGVKNRLEGQPIMLTASIQF